MVSHTGIPSWAVTGMMRRNLVAQRHRDTWENGASWPVCPGTSLLTHSSMRVLLPSVCAAEGEEEREREREREKHQSVTSHTCPNQGSSPQPRYVP